MDRRIQMLERIHAMAVEIVSRIFQMVVGVMHRFERRRDFRMRCG